jgi:hypothetical protein
VHFCNLAETRLEIAARLILDPAIFNEKQEVMSAILARRPAEVIDVAVECEWTSRWESESQPFLNLGLEDGQPQSIDGIFQPCVLKQLSASAWSIKLRIEYLAAVQKR